MMDNGIIVQGANGMQLSAGYIQKGSLGFSGYLPGIVPCAGKTVESVRIRLEEEAKKYFGDDVIVEIRVSQAMEI